MGTVDVVVIVTKETLDQANANRARGNEGGYNSCKDCLFGTAMQDAGFKRQNLHVLYDGGHTVEGGNAFLFEFPAGSRRMIKHWSDLYLDVAEDLPVVFTIKNVPTGCLEKK